MLRSKGETEVLAKYRREVCNVDIGKATGREAPVGFLPGASPVGYPPPVKKKATVYMSTNGAKERASGLVRSAIEDTRDYNKKFSLVHERAPSFVDIKNTTTRDHFYQQFVKQVEQMPKNSLDPKPEATSKHTEKAHTAALNMAKQPGRDKDTFSNQFHPSLNKKGNLTSKIDYRPTGSTVTDDPNTKYSRKNWDRKLDVQSAPAWKKQSERKPPPKSLTSDLDYNPNYDQTRPSGEILHKSHQAVLFKKQTNRKVNFHYNWLALLHTHTLQPKEPPQGYTIKYDAVEVSPRGGPNIKKTTGRDTDKPGSVYYEIRKNTNDLSYTPNFKQVSSSAPAVDVFLCTGRNNDVASITKSVDTLISNVKREMQRLGMLNDDPGSNRSNDDLSSLRGEKTKKGKPARYDEDEYYTNVPKGSNQKVKRSPYGQLKEDKVPSGMNSPSSTTAYNAKKEIEESLPHNISGIAEDGAVKTYADDDDEDLDEDLEEESIKN